LKLIFYLNNSNKFKVNLNGRMIVTLLWKKTKSK